MIPPSYSPLSLFFRACLIGGLFCLLFTLFGCGGSFSDDSEDQNSEEEIKTTQPVNCVNNPTCR